MDALFAKATDFFLFRGDFGRLCTVWAFGYCLSAALAARGFRPPCSDSVERGELGASRTAVHW